MHKLQKTLQSHEIIRLYHEVAHLLFTKIVIL